MTTQDQQKFTSFALQLAATLTIFVVIYFSQTYEVKSKWIIPADEQNQQVPFWSSFLSTESNFSLPVNTTGEKQNELLHNNKSAIVYLAEQSRQDNLAKSVALLFDNFNRKYRYPVIIFYDEKHSKDYFNISQLFEKLNFTDEDKSLISFEYLTFVFPDGISENDTSIVKVWPKAYPMYQHMIAFWSYHVFHHPSITSLEYYLRLDTDSYITKPVKVDFIEKFRRKSVHYAYLLIEQDPDWVVRGMAQFLAKYVRDNKLTPAQPSKLQDLINANKEMVEVPLYYNNFEVVHVPTFLRSDMEQFRKALYDTKRIYTHRWGDAPQRYLMVNLFLNNIEVYNVCECAYEHQSARILATC